MASTRSWTEREAARILSIPGCEHPATSTNPFDVRNANDSSRISRVPGTSETTETAQTSGTSSVVSLIHTNRAPDHGVPWRIVAGGWPLWYGIWTGSEGRRG